MPVLQSQINHTRAFSNVCLAWDLGIWRNSPELKAEGLGPFPGLRRTAAGLPSRARRWLVHSRLVPGLTLARRMGAGASPDPSDRVPTAPLVISAREYTFPPCLSSPSSPRSPSMAELPKFSRSRNNNIRSFGKIIRVGAPRYWRERQSWLMSWASGYQHPQIWIC
jgi:hypothetical protein